MVTPGSTALLTNEESKGVKLSFSADGLTLTSRAPEMGEAEIHVKLAHYAGEPTAIGGDDGELVARAFDQHAVDGVA